MPANIWTPTALLSETSPWRSFAWRAVEAQHKVSTMSLAHGNLADQTTLESILEEVKPLLPLEAQGLHWLLSTPFRYFPPQGGSRFRRRSDPGVFYGAAERKTACAEVGYWRWKFWMDSDGLQIKSKTVQFTLFEFQAATEIAIDLSLPKLSSDRVLWMQDSDYSHTHTLAANAREAGIELIQYESVRHEGGRCLAILSPQMFRGVNAYQDNQQTWNLHIQPPNLTTWQRELSSDGFTFKFS